MSSISNSCNMYFSVRTLKLRKALYSNLGYSLHQCSEYNGSVFLVLIIYRISYGGRADARFLDFTEDELRSEDKVAELFIDKMYCAIVAVCTIFNGNTFFLHRAGMAAYS